MWDTKEINTKKRYVIKRLNNCNDIKEKKILELSLISYLYMLDNTANLKNTKFYYIIDKLLNNKLTIKRDNLVTGIVNNLFFKNEILDNNYLEFLLTICDNITDQKCNNESKGLSYININLNNMLKTTLDFFKSLEDKEILEKAKKIMNDKSCFNIVNNDLTTASGMKYLGMTIYDYMFNKPYICINSQNNLYDYQTVNHEIMHGIDFLMNKKTPMNNYYGFHEIPTYTIDYLFLEYLISNNFNKEEVEILKKNKNDYLRYLAAITKIEIKDKLVRNNIKGYKVENIKEILTTDLIKQLLELESSVISYALYNQIKLDKEYGINNLKRLIKTNIPQSKTPDFNFIGLDQEEILQLSKTMIADKEYTKCKMR